MRSISDYAPKGVRDVIAKALKSAGPAQSEESRVVRPPTLDQPIRLATTVTGTVTS